VGCPYIGPSEIPCIATWFETARVPVPPGDGEKTMIRGGGIATFVVLDDVTTPEHRERVKVRMNRALADARAARGEVAR
jgi:hypothetical protein